MSSVENGGYRLEDLGQLTEVGDLSNPESISWLNFPGVDFDRDIRDNDISPEDEYVCSVPVLTKDLLEAGVELDKPDVNGNVYVWAEVNVDARDRGDVKPNKFSPTYRLTKEDMDNF